MGYIVLILMMVFLLVRIFWTFENYKDLQYKINQCTKECSAKVTKSRECEYYKVNNMVNFENKNHMQIEPVSYKTDTANNYYTADIEYYVDGVQYISEPMVYSTKAYKEDSSITIKYNPDCVTDIVDEYALNNNYEKYILIRTVIKNALVLLFMLLIYVGMLVLNNIPV